MAQEDILIFSGSPRKAGNSELLLRQVMTSLEQAGRACRHIRLPGLDIHPCIGCNSCARTGTCVFTDAMVELYARIGRCRAILIVSPIYFYGVTAQCKVFIGRCQALWSRKYVLGQTRGIPPRPGYFLSVGASRGKRLFTGAELTVRYGLDAMHCTYDASLLVPGMDTQGEVAHHPDLLARARAFGRTIAAA